MSTANNTFFFRTPQQVSSSYPM